MPLTVEGETVATVLADFVIFVEREYPDRTRKAVGTLAWQLVMSESESEGLRAIAARLRQYSDENYAAAKLVARLERTAERLDAGDRSAFEFLVEALIHSAGASNGVH